MKFVRLTFLEDGVIDIAKKEIVAVSSDPDSSESNSVVWLKSGSSFVVRETHSYVLELLEKDLGDLL